MLFLPHKNMERITKFILFVSDQEVVYFGFCSHFPFFLMYYLEISHQELFLLFSAFNSFGCSSQIIKVMKSAMNISVESKIKSLMKAYFHTKICIQMFIAHLLVTIKKGKQFKCPSIGK